MLSNVSSYFCDAEKLYTQQWSRIDGVGALIITPTRELAYQVTCLKVRCEDSLFTVGFKAVLRIRVVYPGAFFFPAGSRVDKIPDSDPVQRI